MYVRHILISNMYFLKRTVEAFHRINFLHYCIKWVSVIIHIQSTKHSFRTSIETPSKKQPGTIFIRMGLRTFISKSLVAYNLYWDPKVIFMTEGEWTVFVTTQEWNLEMKWNDQEVEEKRCRLAKVHENDSQGTGGSEKNYPFLFFSTFYFFHSWNHLWRSNPPLLLSYKRK